MVKLPSVGLALSGGTAKSVTHVGVIKALVEADIPVSFVAGTSGGSIVGTMFASGMPISTMETVATNMSWRKLVSIRLTRMGFISSERIEEFVTETIGHLYFEDLAIPSGVVATNLVTGDRKIFRHGSVARAVRASCSIPQIYLPVEIEGEYYVDGGLSEYLPVETAQELGAEFVIASHLAPVDPTYRRPRNILQLVVQVTGLMARKNFPISEQKADFVVHPNVDAYSSFDFDHSAEMIEIGYDATKRLIADLKDVWQRAGGLGPRIARKLLGE
ncbi:MAG: patatin-like phospholipase family protein [Candidatus Krumholzibacteria bacterium]|nr:patatin-like phospholipase family protein [Candidatus Krumholzibacteria bacterium]MDH4336050.1 patatin-like phospholipase family protein [Candidatus Krumholzibacteria bacterium]MDH5268374.1 patatin-like phospholipase family protein [Candidatus Krumholzibacteria bacterium]